MFHSYYSLTIHGSYSPHAGMYNNNYQVLSHVHSKLCLAITLHTAIGCARSRLVERFTNSSWAHLSLWPSDFRIYFY